MQPRPESVQEKSQNLIYFAGCHAIFVVVVPTTASYLPIFHSLVIFTSRNALREPFFNYCFVIVCDRIITDSNQIQSIMNS